MMVIDWLPSILIVVLLLLGVIGMLRRASLWRAGQPEKAKNSAHTERLSLLVEVLSPTITIHSPLLQLLLQQNSRVWPH